MFWHKIKIIYRIYFENKVYMYSYLKLTLHVLNIFILDICWVIRGVLPLHLLVFPGCLPLK